MESNSETSEAESLREEQRRTIFALLSDLRDRCDHLLSSRDPFDVYNKIHGLRSTIGQIDAASRRYRNLY